MARLPLPRPPRKRERYGQGGTSGQGRATRPPRVAKHCRQVAGTQTSEHFEVPKQFDLEDFMRPSFGVFQGEPAKIKVWFAADIAGYIREKVWHESQRIQTLEDGSIIFEAEVAGTEEVKFWIMSWGVKALILEPGSLSDELRSEANELNKFLKILRASPFIGIQAHNGSQFNFYCFS